MRREYLGFMEITVPPFWDRVRFPVDPVKMTTLGFA